MLYCSVLFPQKWTKAVNQSASRIFPLLHFLHLLNPQITLYSKTLRQLIHHQRSATTKLEDTSQQEIHAKSKKKTNTNDLKRKMKLCRRLSWYMLALIKNSKTTRIKNLHLNIKAIATTTLASVPPFNNQQIHHIRHCFRVQNEMLLLIILSPANS